MNARCASFFFVAAAMAVCGRAQTTTWQPQPSSAEPATLQPGVQVTGLLFNTPLVFPVRCTAGALLAVTAQQQGTHIVVSIFSPAHVLLLRAEYPNNNLGPVLAATVCKKAGSYTVQLSGSDQPDEPATHPEIRVLHDEVRVAENRPGELPPLGSAPYYKLPSRATAVEKSNFTLDLEPLRKATADDRLRVQAAAETAAVFALAQGTPEERHRALPLLQHAVGNWTRAHADYQSALFTAFIGELYAGFGDTASLRSAIPFLRRGADLQHAAHDDSGDHKSSRILGDVLNTFDDNENAEAAAAYTRALALVPDGLDHPRVKAMLLGDLGDVYFRTDKRKALVQYEAAVGSRDGHVLDGLGSTEAALGESKKAVFYYTSAIDLLGESSGKAIALSNLGVVQFDTGDAARALDSATQAMVLETAQDDKVALAATQTNLGTFYLRLGQSQKALDLFQQALAAQHALNSRRDEAVTLNDLGALYATVAAKAARAAPVKKDSGADPATIPDATQQRALEFYAQSLTLREALGDCAGQAHTLSNIGSTRAELGSVKEALALFGQALALERTAGEQSNEAATLVDIAMAEYAVGRKPQALAAALNALALARSARDPALVADIDDSLMAYFRSEGQPRIAIVFGFDAVNSIQTIRRNIAGLDTGLRSGYTRYRSATYRSLAELLAGQGRLVEAEHVLDLLKEVELKEAVRGMADDPVEKVAPLAGSAAETGAQTAIATQSTTTAADLTADSFEFDSLNALPAPTADQQARLKVLSDEIAAGNAAINTFFNQTLYAELGNASAANATVSAVDSDTSSLANLLPGFDKGTLGLYTLIGDQHSYIIVTTANTRKRYEIATNAADLGTLVLSLKQLLDSEQSEPARDLEKLDHLLLDPIAADLAAAAKQSPDHIPTLLWSLDGVLRYVPMSALYDSSLPEGQRYLVERARSVVITPESRNHLADPPSAAPLKAAVFGVSQHYAAFANLPQLNGVPTELDAVVHDPAVAASHGPLAGTLLSNDDFTVASLEAGLRTRPAIVHIASHFVFQQGDAGDGYLLLGGDTTGGSGYSLTLSRLQSDPQLSFRGTLLLTLSACDTAMPDTNANGREIDSLGMVLQKRDAAAILATLWRADDAGTSLLMSNFYSLWSKAPGAGKIEALRQAQLIMLHGKPVAKSSAKRGATPAKDDSDLDNIDYPGFSHPFYWAPFVLIGNFR